MLSPAAEQARPNAEFISWRVRAKSADGTADQDRLAGVAERSGNRLMVRTQGALGGAFSRNEYLLSVYDMLDPLTSAVVIAPLWEKCH